MTEIICECGHSVREHAYSTVMHRIDCCCLLGTETVEARHFARHFYRQFQHLLKECEIMKAQLADMTYDRDAWKGEYNMFAKAWLREIGGQTIPKTHLIDALVLTTRELFHEREALRIQLAETQDDLEIARAGIDEIVAYAQYDPCNDEYPVKVARETKDKLNRRHT